MKYNIATREIFIRDILANMKSRLDAACDNKFEITYVKQPHLQEFGYLFTIATTKNITPEEYDKFVELKNVANEMFNFILNPEMISCSMCSDTFNVEFEIASNITYPSQKETK